MTDFDPSANDLTDLGTLKAFMGIPAGRVLSIDVTPHDGVYATPPPVSLTGTGSGFVGVPALDVDGHLVGVAVKKQGFGFSAGATGVVIGAAPTSGTPATATAKVEQLESMADDPLARMISAASRTAVRYARLFVYGSADDTEETELYNGDGSDLLLLHRRPVLAISEVKIAGDTIPASVPDSAGVLQTGWIWDPKKPAQLRLIGRRFTCGQQNVSVKYTAGLVKGASFDLLEIEQAVLMIAAANWNRRDNLGFTSKNDVAEHSTVATFTKSYIPEEALEILDDYRERFAA